MGFTFRLAGRSGAALFCALVGLGVHAEPEPAAGLSLAEARDLALARNWDQLSAQRDVTVAEARRATAREWANPTLGISSTHINTDGRGNAAGTGNRLWARTYDSVFSLSQPLEIGGKRAARRESAMAGYEGARARLADAGRTLSLAVARAYVAAALAETAAGIATDSAGQLRAEAGVASVRLKVGDIAQSELDRIEIAARQMELQAQAARATATGQRAALELLLGKDRPTGGLVLRDNVESLAAAPTPPAPAPDSARADLAVAEQILRKADADLRLQRAQRIPDPSLLVQYEHQPPDSPHSVGVGIAFPLPLWNRNGGAIREATTVREQASLALNKIKAQIAADIAITRVAFTEARARWDDYRDNVRPRSARVRETVSLAYEKGGASLLELLETQRGDSDVRLAAAQAAADAAVAGAEWQAATANFQSVSTARP